MGEFMQESDRMPLAEPRRRSSDLGRHKFFRFDPTVSTGTLLTLATMVLGAVVAYGSYREDQTKVRADIEAVRVQAAIDRETFRSSVGEMRGDIKDTKDKIGSIDTSLAVLKAQALNPPASRTR